MARAFRGTSRATFENEGGPRPGRSPAGRLNWVEA